MLSCPRKWQVTIRDTTPGVHAVRAGILQAKAMERLQAAFENGVPEELALAHAEITRAKSELTILQSAILTRWSDATVMLSPAQQEQRTEEWHRIHREHQT